MSENVLLVGGGGREHALAWRLKQSQRICRLCIAPGNVGTAKFGENIPIGATDINGLLDFAKSNKIGLTIVGPDDPLALGIVDQFQSHDLPIFGPTQRAAKIESSKVFSKTLMQSRHIPTADFCVFEDYGKALSYIRKHGAPVVPKADGLALGKGARVCKTLKEAEDALHDIMVNRMYGDAGKKVVIEDFLEGLELSIHAFCSGRKFILFPPAQDHKPLNDNNEGPNTGGMGAYVPVPWVKAETMQLIGKQIVSPILEGLFDLGRPFTGNLYPGTIMTADGPKVLEYNARFGDPETQVYMRLLKTDLLTILKACIEDRLEDVNIEWHPGFAVCVVLASGGYPGEYKKGLPISGIQEAEKVPGVVVFHAGTALADGQLVTAGGRVLGVSAIGDTLQEARARAYAAAGRIHFEGVYYRKDIGQQSLA